jgi:succinate-semialdehyde dehydrogenase/glutarate-semialdehyde dehydrogenase
MEKRMYINGEWVESESGDTFEIYSPATGEVIAELPKGDIEDVRKAVYAAAVAKNKSREMSPFARAAICHKIADILKAQKNEIARELALEQGKPYKTEALLEVEATVEQFRMAAEDIKRLETSVIPSRDINKRILTIRQPKGVYGIITPWNFPLAIPAEYIAPALVSGNTIVWKPASYTSGIAVRLAGCLDRAGVPKGVFNFVTGPGGIVGSEIATNPKIDALGLTGSSTTGQEVAKKAAGKSLLLELGGNGPTIALDDADIQVAAERAAFGCFLNAGQVCDSTERILVSKKIHDEFVKRVIDIAKSVKLGNPLNDDTTMGPINNEDTAAKVDRHVKDALEKGAKILYGGKRAKNFPTNLYYEPTVVDNITEDMLLNTEETFGPVAAIMTFSEYDEAIEISNRSILGLQSALFTSSLRNAFYFAERIQTGNVVVNDSTVYWESHTPFGGCGGKRSGYGRLGGKNTIVEMTDLKTIVIDLEKVKK